MLDVDPPPPAGAGVGAHERKRGPPTQIVFEGCDRAGIAGSRAPFPVSFMEPLRSYSTLAFGVDSVFLGRLGALLRRLGLLLHKSRVIGW